MLSVSIPLNDDLPLSYGYDQIWFPPVTKTTTFMWVRPTSLSLWIIPESLV